MDKNFAIGLALGIICGALVVSNSYKARKLVKDSQTQIKEKVSNLTSNKGDKEEYDDVDD